MEEQKTGGRIQLRNDVILIVSVLLVSVVALVYLFVFRKQGDTVKVTVDGKLYGTYSLSQNHSENIHTGQNGEELNRFVINDGKVYMEKASCPDGICVAHRSVFRDGESIVCLPNRVVITVISDSSDESVDIVA